jgi:hypothetical protein
MTSKAQRYNRQRATISAAAIDEHSLTRPARQAVTDASRACQQLAGASSGNIRQAALKAEKLCDQARQVLFNAQGMRAE